MDERMGDADVEAEKRVREFFSMEWFFEEI